MCGIVGYVGSQEAYPILIKGLKRLEYRGYDSAGVAIVDEDDINLIKCKGKVADLESKANGQNLKGTLGIGHTRWATHGPPNDVNSHPHYSQSKNLAIIHNGIIENYDSLKKELVNQGYRFESETDTEVLINFIEMVKDAEDLKLEDAVRVALNQVVGAYAIAIVERGNTDKIVLAKKGSPLVVGIGDDEFFIASDATPFVEYTKNAVYLEDEEMAVIERGKKLEIKSITDNKSIDPYIHKLQMHLEEIEKGGYDHFMLKEIFEQPRSIRDTLRGRLLPDEGIISMSGVKEYGAKFENASRILFVACGTSWHAGLVAEYMFEEFARIPVEVEYASEFRYRNPIITEDDVVIAISQSGETADTLAAIELAKKKGATIFGICNVVGSSIARASHAGAYTHAGPEIGVASTKAFTAQVAVLALIALEIGRRKGALTESRFRSLISELDQIPKKVEQMLESEDTTVSIAEMYKDVSNFLYLGRGYNFPVALEGALKLKEISYIHAEGYPAAEMKHGPIALIDENMPVVVIATKNGQYEKVVSNIQEIKARNGKIIAVVNEGDETIREMADHVIEIPDSDEAFTPLITTIPLQLLSYHIAVMRGCNVDQPRNLAKSVTVE
ncbi:glutamine--fructose-6-phosphate transaminase (isomerizing) [Salibacter sp.]|uniref:glutamine--fructose-6-phosphate transaminase (isomerizing) n=1 Tax=Salibacter sp. TaxID=2010995 RepID=UPI0028701ABF|nr:glutamine--fructose-6-phosphate transaminase (isomerizing) [Salibacter sp.]MDR9397453.1 glutamine--fructose-6-phosphate transaminase (isomerizing) [Salibacter sp.]MDR9486687.1 glutamine--fructose-6-phosphate transaminase (isomerizing) [Salibacter sp.]